MPRRPVTPLRPWQALHVPRATGARLAALQQQILDLTADADPLADPPARHTVVAGDWHGDLWRAQLVVAEARYAGADVVLSLGDFGFWPGLDGTRYLDLLSRAAERADVYVAWLDGNHEDHDTLDRFPVAACGLRSIRPHIWHLPRGHRWTWSGRTWMAVGGAVSVDRNRRVPHRTWWPQEALTDAEADRIAASGPVDVLLTHDRPQMAADALGEPAGSWHEQGLRNGWAKPDLVASDEHSARLQRVVDATRPARLFHGHLHRRYDLTVTATPWETPCAVSGLADQKVGPENAVRVRTDDPALAPLPLRRG